VKAAQTSFQRSCPINWRQNVGIKILWHDDVYRGCGLEEPWTLGRKKNMGFIMDSWDGSKWLIVSQKNNSWIVETC
jgi:hypothetical protein